MAVSWKSYFDFVFRYTYFAFLPPFITPITRRFIYLPILIALSCVIRCFLSIVIDNKKTFEDFYILDQALQITTRSLLYISHRKAFREFFEHMNKILEDNTEYKAKVYDAWQKNKPDKFVKYYTLCQAFAGAAWILQADYKSFSASEKFSESPYPFYSPFFKWGGIYKAFKVFYDTIMAISMVSQIIYCDVVTITLLRFADGLFLHLKLLLEEISVRGRTSKDRDYKIWIQKHVEVLNLINHLKKLLEPHVAVQYLSTVFGVVSYLLALLEKNTAQSSGQKYSGLAIVGGMLLMLGYECSLVENMLTKHSFMYEALVRSECMYKKTKESYFLRMLILRCQRPMKISGFGVFSIDIKNFKELSLQIYKFYSSLVSVKSNRQYVYESGKSLYKDNQ